MSTHYSQYRHLAIEEAKTAPTDEELSAIESLLGTSLPDSFREFLQVANGGYMEYVVDVTFDDGHSEPLSFCSLFSTEAGSFCDATFLGEIRSSREYQKIPPGVLPFARTGGGSMVFLDLSAEGQGRVVAFVEGLPDWTGLRTQSSYVELAASFDEYVDKLRIDREALIDHLMHDATNTAHVDATEEWLDIGLPSWREDPEIIAAVSDARDRVTAKE